MLSVGKGSRVSGFSFRASIIIIIILSSSSSSHHHHHHQLHRFHHLAGSSIDKVKVFGRMQGIVGLWMWEDDLQAGP